MPDDAPPDGFLDALRALQQEGAVFSSPVEGSLYAVETVSDDGATVLRLTASQPARVSAAGYGRAVQTVRQAGGRLPARALDPTAAVRSTYLQGPDLALDGRDAVALGSPDDAAAVLVASLATASELARDVLRHLLNALDDDATDNRITTAWLTARLGPASEAVSPADHAGMALLALGVDPAWLLVYADPHLAATTSLESDHVRYARLRTPFWTALGDARLRARVRSALSPTRPAMTLDLDTLTRAVDRSIRPVLVDAGALADADREGYHHGQILPTTLPLLTPDSVRADPVEAATRALGANVNLLSRFEYMKAKTFVGHVAPDALRDALLDLLYAPEAVADRVDRFVALGDAAPGDGSPDRSLNGTVASYLLAASQPERYAFCKPTVYTAAAKALLGEVPKGSHGDRVAHCTAFYAAALPLLQAQGLPFTDLLHVHIAFYVMLNNDTALGWDGLDKPGATTARVVKITPGPDATLWDECRDGGYVCVGWDDVGDLSLYPSKDALRAAFARLDTFNGHAATQSRKASELWTLRELRPGDLVVANKGTSEVLAVGTVGEEGYVWRPDRPGYRHTVAVEWDEHYAQTIPAQPYWPFVTVLDLDADLAARILGTEAPTSDPADRARAHAALLAAPGGRLVLERHNVVLYGPPGTGKTRASDHIAGLWRQWQGDGSVEGVTFHPTFAYEDFVEGFRPDPQGGGFALTPGIFVDFCDTARESPDRAFLLLVDEINRGDVARILGELITLLEPDKRTPAHSRTLPYSHRAFSVPPNLFVLGTMNTADRSISLMDVAVRRRFAFVETPPDPSVFEASDDHASHVAGVPLAALLVGLNRRLLAAGVDRDRAIGHSYLLVADDAHAPSRLADRLRYDVFPIVDEYCYADRDRVREVLGRLVSPDGRLDDAVLADPNRFERAIRSLADLPTDAADA